jgi:hypothetical protein
MLRSPWHNMHAQRGSELGNGTADEHSGTLMRASTDRTSRSRWAAANPSLIGHQLVEFLLATGLADSSHQCLSVSISVHLRFPIEVNRSQKVRHHQLGVITASCALMSPNHVCPCGTQDTIFLFELVFERSALSLSPQAQVHSSSKWQGNQAAYQTWGKRQKTKPKYQVAQRNGRTNVGYQRGCGRQRHLNGKEN